MPWADYSRVDSEEWEVASCGQSVVRRHLLVYEPTEVRVSTRVNGLLYSLPERKLGNGGEKSGQVVDQGLSPQRIPTYFFIDPNMSRYIVGDATETRATDY